MCSYNGPVFLAYEKIQCIYSGLKVLTLSQQQILDSFKLKDFKDKNFRFDENGTKFFKWVENTLGKGEIAGYKQFLLFPQCFQKICTATT